MQLDLRVRILKDTSRRIQKGIVVPEGYQRRAKMTGEVFVNAVNRALNCGDQFSTGREQVVPLGRYNRWGSKFTGDRTVGRSGASWISTGAAVLSF